MLKVILLLIPITLCLFEYILFRYNVVFRESEAFLLDSQIQWMLYVTIFIWCLISIILRFKLDDAWLVGFLLIAAVIYFKNYLSAFEPTRAIILLAGVTLGRVAAFLFQEKRYCDTFGYSFAALQTRKIKRDLILILILLFSLSSWLHFDMTGSIYHGPRWMGLWNNPNVYGMLMGAGVVLAIGLLAQKLKSEGLKTEIEKGRTESRKRKPEIRNLILRLLHFFAAKDMAGNSWNASLRVFLFVAAGIMGVGLVMSYSRGAWLATAIGILYLAWFYGKLKWRYVLPVVLVAATVVALFWHATSDDGPWYLKRLDFSRPSAQHRVSAWRGAIQMMWDHPFGVGWNRAVEVYEKDYSPPEGGAAALTTNDYLMLGTQLGWPGLICFLTYVGLALKTENRKQKAETLQQFGNRKSEIGNQVACRAGAIVLLVAFWFDGGLFTLATASVFWILLELGACRTKC